MTLRASREAVARARSVECPDCTAPAGARCRPGPSTHAARFRAAVAAYSAAEPVDLNAGPAVHMVPLHDLDPVEVLGYVETLPDLDDPEPFDVEAWLARVRDTPRDDEGPLRGP